MDTIAAWVCKMWKLFPLCMHFVYYTLCVHFVCALCVCTLCMHLVRALCPMHSMHSLFARDLSIAFLSGHNHGLRWHMQRDTQAVWYTIGIMPHTINYRLNQNMPFISIIDHSCSYKNDPNGFSLTRLSSGQPKVKLKVCSLISSLNTYHKTLHFIPWSLDLFIRVPFELHGEHTAISAH